MKIAKNRKHPVNLTADKLRELMLYDPENGTFKWKAKRNGVRRYTIPGRLSANGYWRIRVNHENHLSHRLAWLYMTGQWPKYWIDHIDGNKLNNKFSNLRECTPSQNHQNKKTMSNNKTALKGSWFDKANKKYKAAISINGIQITIGYFNTVEEAHNAYCKAAKELYGSFARLK